MKEGIYYNMSYAEYNAIDALRSTQLKRIISDTRERLSVDIAETASLAFGRAAHVALLEPSDFKNQIATVDNLRTNAGKDEKAQAEKSGKQVINGSDLERINCMINAIRTKQCDATSMLRDAESKTEVTVVAREPTSGVLCKARLDLINEKVGVWLDYKTTRSARVADFEKQALQLDYDMSAAFHCDVAKWAGLPDFCFKMWLAQEKDSPYLFNLIQAADWMIHGGRNKYKQAISNYNKNGYSGFVESCSDYPPTWYSKKYL